MLWILINSFPSFLSGLVVILVHLASLEGLLLSTTFGCKMNLLINVDNGKVAGTTIIGFLHKRVEFNINNLLLVFISFPTTLQHHHTVVFAPAGNTLCKLLVMDSHHICHM